MGAELPDDFLLGRPVEIDQDIPAEDDVDIAIDGIVRFVGTERTSQPVRRMSASSRKADVRQCAHFS